MTKKTQMQVKIKEVTMKDEELFAEDFHVKLMSMSIEDRRQVLARREKLEQERTENNRRYFGQGLSGRYGLVYYYRDNDSEGLYQVVDWKIESGWLSAIVLEWLMGEEDSRLVMPTSRVKEIFAYEDQNFFRQDAKRAYDRLCDKREREKASPQHQEDEASMRQQVKDLKAKGYKPDDVVRIVKKRRGSNER